MDLHLVSLTTVLAFAGAGVVLILTPGPDMFYVLTRGAAHGPRAGIAAACGLSVGILGHTTMAALGVAAILQASATLFMIVKLAGALFLLYMGVRMMFSRRVLETDARRPVTESLPRIFVESIFTNLLNPKVALFFVAFLPQFVQPEDGMVAWQMIQLGLVMGVLSLLIKSQLGLFAGTIRGYLTRRAAVGTRIQQGAGAIIALLGIHLGFTSR
jgi:threonine/homoserine/homoserine lactone efflux protein